MGLCYACASDEIKLLSYYNNGLNAAVGRSLASAFVGGVLRRETSAFIGGVLHREPSNWNRKLDDFAFLDY